MQPGAQVAKSLHREPQYLEPWLCASWGGRHLQRCPVRGRIAAVDYVRYSPTSVLVSAGESIAEMFYANDELARPFVLSPSADKGMGS
jgi:hypothetical protein